MSPPWEQCARPTSRRRARCVSFRMGQWWEQTAAGPRAGTCRLRRRALGDAASPRRGKGCCRCARSTLFAPAEQRRCRVARRIMVCRGREQGFGTFRPSRGFPGAPGNGFLPARGGVFPARRHPYALPMSLSAQETEIRAISQSERTLPLAKSSTFIHPWQTRPFTSRVSSIPHFAANIQRTPKPSFPRLFPLFRTRKRPSLRPSRRSLIPRHPAGRTAGSARTRSRVQLRLSLQVQQKGKDRTSQGPVLEWR